MFLGFSVTSIFTSQRGFRPNPLTSPPFSYASESIYSINAHVTRDREFMVAHNCHGKNKNLTAKSNTTRQKQNSFGFAVGICFCREVFGFCCEVFSFAVGSFTLWFCREVFGFVVRYFVFAVRFLFLPWGFRFCREVFCFCREVFGFAVTVGGHRNEIQPGLRHLTPSPAPCYNPTMQLILKSWGYPCCLCHA